MGKPKSKKESSSKADRRHEKKVEFYTKVGESIAALNAQKTIVKKKKLRSRQKKLKAYNLSALSDFLSEVKPPQKRAPAELKGNSSKSRHKLILKEGKQLSTVLNHPIFQSNPLVAIQQHLQSTQPVDDEEPKKKRKNKNGSQKRKDKILKENRVQSSLAHLNNQILDMKL